MADIRRITNARAYINGTDFLGMVKEISLPELESVTSEIEALGLHGKMSSNDGIGVLEGSITWNSVYPDAMRNMGKFNKVSQLQIRTSQKVIDSTGVKAEEPVVWTLQVQPTSFGLGEFKQHEVTEHVSKFTINAVRVEVNGQEFLNYDVPSNTFVVDGEDMLAAFKSNTN